jgi:hypothetical protein
MKIINTKKNEATVILSEDDICFLKNTINETFEALDDREFQTRTGWSLDEARQLQSSFREMLKSVK